MRVILYTGKGGVGKTSVAAASACALASRGFRVLIMSTDQAHSLGDSFGMCIGKEPTHICENLDAMEVDSVFESEKSWGRLKAYFRDFLTAGGQQGIEVEELLVFPGLEELFSMFKILDISEEGRYDILIVDCAPTGETLSLLKYPEQLSDFMNKVLPMKRKAVHYAGPAVQKITKIPMPKDNVFDDIEFIMEKMKRLQNLMLDKEKVSLRIVTTPEKIVIREAKKNFTCLHLYDYNVDAIVINRIYPLKAMEGYFSQWLQMQEEGLEEISQSFSEVPILKLELQQKEITTVPTLEIVGEKLYQQRPLEKVLFSKKIYIVKQDSLEIYLPFAEKDEMELEQVENEVVVTYKNQTRRFTIPVGKEIASAKMENGYLDIAFNL